MDLDTMLALIAAPIYAKIRAEISSEKGKEAEMKLAIKEAKQLWEITTKGAYK